MTITISPIVGVPEIEPGADLGAELVQAAGPASFADGDVVVVAQKVVSKAEGRFASAAEKTAAIAQETARILRRTGGGMVIAETHHGYVCANAGVDASNVPGNNVLLLPLDPDLSARRIRAQIEHGSAAMVAVIVSDTFGRAWRLGQTNVAIGVAGMEPFADYRGKVDPQGRELAATRICIADELAGAAELVMGKTEGVCAAIVRGARYEAARGAGAEIVRPVEEDLFR